MPIKLFQLLGRNEPRQGSRSVNDSFIPNKQNTKPRSATEDAPSALPPPQLTHNDGSSCITSSTPSRNSLKGPSISSPPTNDAQRSENNGDGTVPNVPLSRPRTDDRGSEISLSADLAPVWEATGRKQTMSKTDKLLQKIEGGGRDTQTNAAVATTAITATVQAVGGTDAIEEGVNHFLEGSATLMGALDEVARLHPFIAVGVVAFKAVYSLEMKRRANNQKIKTLHDEMRSMMMVLLELKKVKDPEATAPDGTSIKGRMQDLIGKTAADLKGCSNACDTYLKMKIVVKVLKGPVWETRLFDYIRLFAQRRSDFEFALTIHTTLGVDAANKTLTGVDNRQQEMDAKLDAMFVMFRNLVTPEAKELTRLVKKKGGIEACQENEQILRELSDVERKTGSPANVGHGGRKAGGRSDFEDLKNDLNLDPDEAMEKNMKLFSRKIEVQTQQLKELRHDVVREGDRVIKAVNAGPHDKIVDPDIYNIWKEMGWRGSAKSRHFIMALRDYFHDKQGLDTAPAEEDNADTRHPDQWALAYVNVVRSQPISEAFDDDASGFVTVLEVNTFTTSRPLNWSLPHWIAYWAVGRAERWHQSLAQYGAKIRDIFAKMFAILPEIRPSNQASVNEYLISVYEAVTTIESSVNPCYVNEALQSRFKTFIEGEEARLKRNLETVDYDIDAMDTLTLVTGRGRIERYVMRLLYLILKRHFEIFRICRRSDIDPNHLWDAANTVNYVMKGVKERVEVLQSIFKQQRLDVKQQFETFAHGLFKYYNDPSGLWDTKSVQEREFAEFPYDDDMEEKDIKIEDILPASADQEALDFAAYDPPTQPSRDEIPQPLKSVLGVWNGFLYRKSISTVPGGVMVSMTLCPTTTDGQEQRFKASGRGNTARFTISGHCSPGEQSGIIEIVFTRKFDAGRPTQHWSGQMDTATDTIRGRWGTDPNPSLQRGRFILKRTAPDYLCFRPALAKFEANKPLALWSFALSAILYHVRQSSWSWSFFSERRKIRERFIELYIRNTEFGCPLDQNETTELRKISRGLTPADSRFYHSIAQYRVRRTTRHGRNCDHCRGPIGGARIICLVCQTKNTLCVDLCSAPGCIEAQVDRDDLTSPHLPTHDLLKVRRVVHVRQFGKMVRAGKGALQRARAAFDEVQMPESEPYDSDDADPVINLTIKQDSGSSTSEAILTCLLCEVAVARPCWYCVQCNNFICNDCDAKGVSSSRHDTNNHDLVRLQVEGPKVDVEISMEDRLAKLEEHFFNHEAVMEERWGQVDGRLASVENAVRDHGKV